VVRLSVELEEELHRRFSVACAERGLSKAEVVRRLLEEWLGRCEVEEEVAEG